MKKLFWLIAAIFISLGAACAPQEEKKMQYNISFLGDSITYGATLSEGELCFADLIARQDYAGHVQNLGISCSTIGHPPSADVYFEGTNPISERYRTVRRDADFIFVLGGTNDYGNTPTNNVPLGVPEDTENVTFYGALNQLVAGIAADYPDAELVLCTPVQRDNSAFVHWPASLENEFGYRLEDYCDAIRDRARHFGVNLLDLYALEEMNVVSERFLNYYTDGIHPNAEGHRLIAGAIDAFLREAITR